MRRWLVFLASLAGLLGANGAAPAQAEDSRSFGLPGGLPEGWSVLDDNAAPHPSPRPSQRGHFDLGPNGFRLTPDQGAGGDRTRPDSLTGSSRPPARAGETPDAGASKSPAARIEEQKRAETQKRAENLKRAMAPQQSPAAARQRVLDELFARLRAAADIDEAKGVAAAIERVWLQSRSDTANLLMQRVLVSLKDQNYPIALALLDKIVALEPDWAEAWNQRATTRFLAGDADGAMADIGQVVRLEPRHFGALAGMGMILQRAGFDKRALQMFNMALAIYPLQPELRRTVEKLTLDIEGRDI